jgi:hypothetical protein
MGEWRRLFYYLLLNVLVSAIATLAVLIVWEKTRSSDFAITQILFPDNAQTPYATMELPAQDAAQTSPPDGATPAVPATNSAPAQAPAPTQVQDAPAPAQPVADAKVIIDSVIAAGDLASEKVLIKSAPGSGDVSLAYWRLTGDKGQEYTFPQLILHANGAVYVFTKKGVDGVFDLYWNRSEPAWQSGAVVSLIDPDGKLHATYSIP